MVQKIDEEQANPELMDSPEFEETMIKCKVVRALMSAEENGDSNQASVSTDDLVESQVGKLFDFLQQYQQNEEAKVSTTIELGSTFDDQDWRIYDQIIEEMENVYVDSETAELVAMFPEEKIASPELVFNLSIHFFLKLKS